MESPRIQRAILSTSDKLGLIDFARGLAEAGVELFSTGGTRRHLEASDIPVQDVSAYTGFPEIMDGRVKTLHPKIFGGILCRHDNSGDRDALAEHGILTFELVVVNLYPFEATIAREGVTWEEAIEQIDIGGPSLVRAAAKNHAFTTIATNPRQYAEILEEVRESGHTGAELRRRLAGEAFAHTARYDRIIADYFTAAETGEGHWPPTLRLQLEREDVLRYGENPHQSAALYRLGRQPGANLIAARQLSGKQLSYNNLLDLDSALGMVRGLAEPTVVVLKHNNPCGAASAETIAEAVRPALEGDPVSAFGSVLGFNRPVDAASAEAMAEPGRFIEAILAPEFTPEALEILKTKPKWKANVRLIAVGDLAEPAVAREYRAIEGGFLVQDADVAEDAEGDWKVVTEAQPSDEALRELRFAWAMVRHVKSNAIVLGRERALVGVGAGQMSRVDSVEIAIHKAGERARGSVLASDAFFPFPDSVEKAASAGVTAVIQPGGSKKDEEVIAACNRHKLPMVLTGRRHFRH